MNERPLDEIVNEAVDRVLHSQHEADDVERILPEVLNDPDLRIILEGYDMHDRSEGLEDVMVRDVRRMVESVLKQRKARE